MKDYERLLQIIFYLYLKLYTVQCPSHIETSQLNCSANQLTGFYVRGTSTVKGLKLYTVQKLVLILLILHIY